MRRVILAYERAYRLLHGLDRPSAQVGPALCLEIRRNRRARVLPDGTPIRRGARVGVLHLSNARAAAVHRDCRSALAAGLEFRRWFLASLRALAELAAARGPHADVQAYAATTIFHRGLERLGLQPEPGGLVWPGLVAAYQRALLASLHPAGRSRLGRRTGRDARRLWITREALLARYARGELTWAPPESKLAR